MRTATPDRSVLTLLIFSALLLFNQASFGQIVFQESSAAAGISGVTFNTGHAHGLGVIWIDYDNDDWPDLFLTNGSDGSAHLFRNEQDGTFSNQDALLPTLTTEEKTGANFADYDNDGDLDIYITVNNSLSAQDGEPNILLQNQWVENGGAVSTPLFIDVAASAGVDNLASPPFGNDPGYQSLTAAWFDYNRDSCIDLFVGNMVFSMGGDPSNDNFLYMNNCDGTFTDVSASSGMSPGIDSDWYRPTLTAFAGIMDPLDIEPDLYVTNVQEFSPFHHDLQFRNNGDGTFTEMVSSMPGIGDDSGAGMGIDIADIDLDGDWDIYMTDLLDPGNEPVAEGNPFYTGNPDGTWNENSAPAVGISAGGSWGIVFVDFDQDGYEDLLVGTGDPILYHNNGDGTFTLITSTSGIPSFGGSSRGLAAADYDRDGDMDVVVMHDGDDEVGGPLHLYENITSHSNNYLQVKLEATQSNRAAINTLLKATTGSTVRMRQVKGAVSAHSQNELLVEFGLGSETVVDQLEVLWPSGEVSVISSVGVNQMITVTEPDGTGEGSTLTASPLSIDFGQVDVGTTSAPVVVTLTNNGTADIDVSDVSLTGDDAAEFGHDFPGSMMIPAGGQGTVNVTFSPTSVSAPLLAGDVLYRVNAGGALVSDWEEDTDANPSTYVNAADLSIITSDVSITLDATVPEGTPMEIFQSHRIDALKADPSIEWDFPVTAGQELIVRLFFSEVVQCRDGGRVFDVVIEGTEVLTDYEVLAEVGCEVGTMKEFTVTPADDNLDINLNLGSTNRPSIISAVEIATTGGSTGGGPKTAQLVIDHNGLNGSQTVELTGEGVDSSGNISPTAAFSHSATLLDVTFTDASTDSDGTIVSWAWDFGDGNTSTEQNPVHSYAVSGTYSVSLTVTDDGGLTDVASEDVTADSGNPTAAFTHTATDLAVDFTDASTDNGTISSWSWDFGDGATSTEQNPSHTYAAAGTYSVSLTVTDNDGLTDTASEDVTVSEGGNGTGAFIESDGMVVMEAENYHLSIDRGEHSWSSNTDNAGFSGAASMFAGPDTGTIILSDVTTTAAELSYDLEITTTGDYYAWVRIWATDADANSVHVGVDGAINDASKGAQTQSLGEWTWLRLARGSTGLTHTIDTPGAHTFNMWLREDGAIIDKAILTTDVDFTPTGEGPAESPQTSAAAIAAKAGDGAISKAIQGDEIQIPTEFALKGNYPNPFNPTTTISFDLAEDSDVTLEVYDMMGRRVATLVSSQLSAGSYDAQWNARSDAGNAVASGVYLYRLQAGSFVAVQRMVLMK